MTREVRVALTGAPGFEADLRAARARGRVWALEWGPGNAEWSALVYVEEQEELPLKEAKPSKTIFGRAKKTC